MVEVYIDNKIKDNKLKMLLSFFCNISTSICFSVSHYYHLDEDDAVELIDEYKKYCKERHYQLKTLYENKEPALIKLLRKTGVNNDESFNDFLSQRYQDEIGLTKTMQNNLDELVNDKTTRDYRNVFKEIGDEFVEFETHMFDSEDIFLSPIDLVTYKMDDKIKELITNITNISSPVLVNSDKNVFYINPLFCNGKDGIVTISTQKQSITFTLTNEQYKEFKKMRINHIIGGKTDD